MRVSEGISVSQYVRNGNFLKMCVIEIRVKRIRINQGVGVITRLFDFRTNKYGFGSFLENRTVTAINAKI